MHVALAAVVAGQGIHNPGWGGGFVVVLLLWAVWEMAGRGGGRGGGSGGGGWGGRPPGGHR